MIGNRIEYDGRTFNHADIKAGNLYQARALLSDSLEIDTFEVTLSSDANLTQFTRNAPLAYFYNDSQVGTYYVQNVRRIAVNKYQFSCTSTVGLLEQTDHNGGIYTGQTVQEVVADICGQYPVKVKTNLQGIALYGWLPIASRRDNLSQVLFAIGATLKVDYDGALRVEGLWGDQSANIDEEHMFDGGRVDYGTPVTQVVVTEHQYTQGDEQVTLFEGTTSGGDKVTFSEPCYNLSSTGFTIIEQGANYAIVGSGNGTLTGYKYVHSTRTVTKQVTSADSENAVKVEDATLVSLANANAVADRLAAYYAHTERVTNDMVLQSESPGDVSSLVHPYGGNVQACIESSDINLSGKLRSTEKLLVGYVPPKAGEIEYYDNVEVITEDGSWTVPDGVTAVRLVLIGGGTGGYSGKIGEESATGSTISQTRAVTDVTTYINGVGIGVGGKGGEAGNGGTGGKILQVEPRLQGGTELQIQIGRGGLGGTYSANDTAVGHAGTATTVGAYTSDDGNTSESGYTEIFSGVVYAAPGDNGIVGGNGSGAKENANGSSGSESVTVIPGTPVLDRSGLQWNPGADNPARNEQDKFVIVHNSSVAHEVVHAGAVGNSYGGCGGGAAAGCDGLGDGESGKATASGSTSSLQAVGRGGKGGTGASATKPEKQLLRGCGGFGGNGGGGAGAGGCGFTQKVAANKYKNPTFYLNAYAGASGVPGDGSDGGDGGDGCVLIYYRTPKVTHSGRFVTRNGADFIDKSNRKVVV